MQIKYQVGYIALISLLMSPFAYAAPQGGEVVAGTTSISQAGNTTTIKQNSWSAVINWKNFDTASNESVVFDQPNAVATVLNRINSGLPTNFAGNLSATGQVFIINPAGMVFAKGSSVNAASFIATTADIDNNDFMKGNYKFSTNTKFDHAAIINNGNITTDTSGIVALIAPNVSNTQTGIIQAHMGTVELASGENFVLDFNQDSLINFDISNLAKNGSLENAGKITANGGTVVMTTQAVSQVLDNVVNMSGVIEAESARAFHSGEVKLVTNSGASINVSGNISSNEIVIDSGKDITLSGKLETTTSVAGFALVSLCANTITQSATSSIKTYLLNTLASQGITLAGENNDIHHFWAVNTESGNIVLNDNRSSGLTLSYIKQLGGDLSITNKGNIVQDYELWDTAYPIIVSGSSVFNAIGNNSSVYLTTTGAGEINQFTGPVNIVSGNNISVANTQFSNTLTVTAPGYVWVNAENNLLLGNADVKGRFDIKTNRGNISQAPNTALTVSNQASFIAPDGSIILNNADNQISGALNFSNIGSSDNLPISFHNSVDLELSSAKSSGVLTLATDGKLNLNHWWDIVSYATKASGGHSIILAGSSLYYGGAYVNPGSTNTLLIYLPNPAAMSSDSFTIHSDGQFSLTPIWGVAYTPDSPAQIPGGNHFVYAGKAPSTV